MRAPAACGTRSGHIRHWRRSEPICTACREADRAYQAERYRRTKTAAPAGGGSTSPAQPDRKKQP